MKISRHVETGIGITLMYICSSLAGYFLAKENSLNLIAALGFLLIGIGITMHGLHRK